MNNKKILVLSEKPLDDYNCWSGTMFNMNKAFREQGYETEWLALPEFSEKELKTFSIIKNVYQKVFNRGFNDMHFVTKAWFSKKHLEREIKKREFDILFAPIAAGYIPFLQIKQPIIYLNDANAAQLFNYNIMFTGFGYLSKEITKFLERKTLNNASANVFSNCWGAEYAVKNYKIKKNKVHTVRFGANMEVLPELSIYKNYSPIKLLFLATRWELKGGDIALVAFRILKSKGYNIKLKIVGCNPHIASDENIEIIPFIDKNKPEGLQKLQNILLECHLMVLPTRNDCSPIVMCEANGYGLPCITTNTGGVGEIIIDGYNGYALPMEAKGNEYAAVIESLINNPTTLQQLSLNSRKRYEEVLNWSQWGKEMQKIIQSL